MTLINSTQAAEILGVTRCYFNSARKGIGAPEPVATRLFDENEIRAFGEGKDVKKLIQDYNYFKQYKRPRPVYDEYVYDCNDDPANSDELITQAGIVRLMGVVNVNPKYYIQNLFKRGKLEGFPKPLTKRINKKVVYNKEQVIAYLNGNKDGHTLAFNFLTGKYDTKEQQARYSINKRCARMNKPTTKRVVCEGIGWY